MKKVTYALLTISLFTISSEINSSTPLNTKAPLEIVSSETTVADIYSFLNSNLGLTTTQKPAVKTAVDEAGAEMTKLNTAATTKTSSEISAAKTSIVNSLIKKLSSGILTSAQSTKLSTLTSQLTTMFSALK